MGERIALTEKVVLLHPEDTLSRFGIMQADFADDGAENRDDRAVLWAISDCCLECVQWYDDIEGWVCSECRMQQGLWIPPGRRAAGFQMWQGAEMLGDADLLRSWIADWTGLDPELITFKFEWSEPV